MDGGDVDHASAGPVDLPVVPAAPGVGTAPGANLGQLQGDLLEGLHQEVNVEAAGGGGEEVKIEIKDLIFI